MSERGAGGPGSPGGRRQGGTPPSKQGGAGGPGLPGGRPQGGTPPSEQGGESLAGAVRELIEQMAATTAPDSALIAAAAAVRDVTEKLRAAGTPRTYGFRANNHSEDAWAYLRFSPVSGVLNPLAVPLRFHADEGGVEGTASFGIAYQGPPGYVHGAFIAAAFDELLGAANSATGNPGMTVRLEVRYRRPTPLHTVLRVVARHTGRDGKRIFASGSMFAGDEVTAEADGVFAEISFKRARELFGRIVFDSGRPQRDGTPDEEGA